MNQSSFRKVWPDPWWVPVDPHKQLGQQIYTVWDRRYRNGYCLTAQGDNVVLVHIWTTLPGDRDPSSSLQEHNVPGWQPHVTSSLTASLPHPALQRGASSSTLSSQSCQQEAPQEFKGHPHQKAPSAASFGLSRLFSIWVSTTSFSVTLSVLCSST